MQTIPLEETTCGNSLTRISVLKRSYLCTLLDQVKQEGEKMKKKSFNLANQEICILLIDCVIVTLYCSSCAKYATVTQHSRIT